MTGAMKTRTCIVLLSLLIAGVTARVAGADDKAVRKEIEAAYTALAKADTKNDGKAYIAMLTADYKRTYPSGKWGGRESIENQFALRSREEKATVTFHIEQLTLKGAQAVAMVKESTRSTYDEKGVRHTVEFVRTLRSTWIKTPKGWRLHLNEEKNRKIYEDGKLTTDD
jgi:ketosteroid isomerase-like protein